MVAKRFIARKHISFNIIKVFICLLLIIIAFIFTVKLLFKLVINMKDENKVNEMLAISTNNLIGNISLLDLVNFNINDSASLLKNNISGIGKITVKQNTNIQSVDKVISDPIIFIYNTHQQEEYSSGSLVNYNITPTVYMASNILQKRLENYNIGSIVESENIKEVLNKNGWNYNESYYASKLWLNRCRENFHTIKYFIDVHRDSASGIVTINDKVYAKMMFVVGMNHDNYKANEDLMIRLNNYLNDHYNGVMRSIFYGHHSKYNQDFDSNTILIEIGGPENNINEVYNSTSIFAEAISNVIGG